MPRHVNQIPAYRKHKASGQGVVTLNGEDVYLGAYGSKQSRLEYDRVIGEWLARGRQRQDPNDKCRVADVVKAYWEFAEGYYGQAPDAGELNSIKRALGVLRRTYGQSPAKDFGPLALQVVREQMVKQGWGRAYVNAQVGRLKRCFKWAASRELIPPSVFHGLQAVAGLRRGKCDARETDPVKPVPEAWVEATIRHVSRQVEALIQLQLASGMRPGEAVTMRGCDIDTTGDVWVYQPQRHKTQHHGHERVIHLAPQARRVIDPFLKPDMTAYLFRPGDAERERRQEDYAARKTPPSCGNTPGSNVQRRPRRQPDERYTVASYRRAIARGADAAFPPPTEGPAAGRKKKATRWETPAEWKARLGLKKWTELRNWQAEHRWHPHQLRHSAATRLRKQFGLEAARVVLGPDRPPHRTLRQAEHRPAALWTDLLVVLCATLGVRPGLRPV